LCVSIHPSIYLSIHLFICHFFLSISFFLSINLIVISFCLYTQSFSLFFFFFLLQWACKSDRPHSVDIVQYLIVSLPPLSLFSLSILSILYLSIYLSTLYLLPFYISLTSLLSLSLSQALGLYPTVNQVGTSPLHWSSTHTNTSLSASLINILSSISPPTNPYLSQRSAFLTKYQSIYLSHFVPSLSTPASPLIPLAVQNKNGQTPLHFAVDFLSIPAVETILDVHEKNHNNLKSHLINILDHDNNTALHMIKADCHTNIDCNHIVKMLISKGINIEIKNRYGRTALQYFDQDYEQKMKNINNNMDNMDNMGNIDQTNNLNMNNMDVNMKMDMNNMMNRMKESEKNEHSTHSISVYPSASPSASLSHDPTSSISTPSLSTPSSDIPSMLSDDQILQIQKDLKLFQENVTKLGINIVNPEVLDH
jgi:hypothetical protein